MNKTTQRAEEARRQAQTALLEAKQRQEAMLMERAQLFATETQKVENLRAQRLAKMESDKAAGKSADMIRDWAAAAKRRRMQAA